jgi:hypothetical protein
MVVPGTRQGLKQEKDSYCGVSCETPIWQLVRSGKRAALQEGTAREPEGSGRNCRMGPWRLRDFSSLVRALSGQWARMAARRRCSSMKGISTTPSHGLCLPFMSMAKSRG